MSNTFQQLLQFPNFKTRVYRLSVDLGLAADDGENDIQPVDDVEDAGVGGFSLRLAQVPQLGEVLPLSIAHQGLAGATCQNYILL